MSTHAVIGLGGKQYRVKEGDTLKTEKLAEEVGTKLTLRHVYLLEHGETATIGTPFVEGATVTAEVVATGKGDKVRVFKMKRRKRLRINKGHRQPYMQIKITKIHAA